MRLVAAIRPDEVNLPLFLHVLGAMLLVGALAAVAAAVLLARRRPEEAFGLTRFALRTIPLGVLPSYLLMRIAAQWTEAEAGYPDDAEPAWLGIGYVTADAGALLTLVSLVLAAVGLRKLRTGSGLGFGRAVGAISALLLAAYVVAVWAMTAKPV